MSSLRSVRGWKVGVVAGSLALGASISDVVLGEVRPWRENPWYWEYRGRPVFLAGASDDDNLFQWTGSELMEQLDTLVACGGNYLRNTMSDRPDRGFEVYPFDRRPDGRYDLERWNPEYWRRFETFLEETGRRGVVVQIEVWDRFDYSRDPWRSHPYNPKNNVNYSAEESGLATEYPDHPGANRQPFFFTVPPLQNNRVVLRYQQRFVDRLLEATLRHDHVLYCIDNETSGAEEWSAWWARYIKEKARAVGRHVHVTEMWDDWDVRAPAHRRTFDHPELYDFADVSQNNHQKGQVHWDRFQWVRQYLQGRPRPINTVKTYGADTGRYGTTQDGLERVWRHALGGAAAVRFHRPDSGLGLSGPARATLRALRLLEGEVPLWELVPDNERLEEREPNEAYLVVSRRGDHVVFFPQDGHVRLRLPDRPEAWTLRWLEILKAAWGEPGRVNSGLVDLKPPGAGLWLALIQPGTAMGQRLR